MKSWQRNEDKIFKYGIKHGINCSVYYDINYSVYYGINYGVYLTSI